MSIDPALQSSVTVKSELDGETYVFRIPSMADKIRFGYASRNIRAKYDPEGMGSLQALTSDAWVVSNAFAVFEQYLTAGPAWVYGNVVPGATVEPKVDHTKFPDNKEAVLLEVADKFDQEVSAFRKARAAANPPS